MALSLRDRLQRTDSRRTLVARNAYTARQALLEISRIPRPKCAEPSAVEAAYSPPLTHGLRCARLLCCRYRLSDAIVFGSFIDFWIFFRCTPCCAPLTRRRPLPASVAAAGIRACSQARTSPVVGPLWPQRCAAGGAAAEGLPGFGPTALPMRRIGSVGMS